MSTISYDPGEDILRLEFAPAKGEPDRRSGAIEIWSNSEGNIYALAILQYTKQSEEFRKNLKTTKLGGIWKGIRITDEDIQATRDELLKRIEGKW
jgi:uncharacterized protein YuzE